MDRLELVRACRLRGGFASRPPPALSKGSGPLGLLKAFRRRWKLAVGLGMVLAVVAGGLARVVPPRPKFEAKVVLLVAAQPPQALFTTDRSKLRQIGGPSCHMSLG